MALAVLVSALVVLATLAVAALFMLRWERRFDPPADAAATGRGRAGEYPEPAGR